MSKQKRIVKIVEEGQRLKSPKSDVSYFYHTDVLTGEKEKYARIVVHNEVMKIHGLKFHMDDVYNVKATEMNDPANYFEPFSDPDYNIHRAYAKYRKLMGFINPDKVKSVRKLLKLSQSDVSDILGIGFGTLSRIEQERIVQTKVQDSLLRILLDWRALRNLLKARIPSMKYKKLAKTNPEDLQRALKIIDRKLEARNPE